MGLLMEYSSAIEGGYAFCLSGPGQRHRSVLHLFLWNKNGFIAAMVRHCLALGVFLHS